MTWLEAGRFRFRNRSGGGKRFLMSLKPPKTIWGPLVLGSFLCAKWPELEVRHPPPSSAEMKNCFLLPICASIGALGTTFIFNITWGSAKLWTPSLVTTDLLYTELTKSAWSNLQKVNIHHNRRKKYYMNIGRNFEKWFLV